MKLSELVEKYIALRNKKRELKAGYEQNVAVIDDTLDKIEAHVKRHAPEVEFIRLHGMEPSKTPLESAFTEPLRQAILDAQGEDPLLVPAMGGSLPDYVWTKILGVHSFGTPYANHDEANHAPTENMEVERCIQGIKTGAAVMQRLGGGD